MDSLTGKHIVITGASSGIGESIAREAAKIGAHLVLAARNEQKLLELEHKVKLLEKQKKFLEHQVAQSDKKSILFDMMIDLAEKEYNIPIRKNSLPEQSTSTEDNTKKA